MKERKNGISRLPLLAVCAVLIALIVTVGVTYARYQEVRDQRISFSGAGVDGIYIRSADGSYTSPDTWKKDASDGSWQLEFLLSNSESADKVAKRTQTAYVRVISGTADITSNTVIELICGEERYTAVPERIDTESVIGQRFGDGRLYRFFNQSGEEVTWMLVGGRSSDLMMKLRVKNGAEGASYTIVAERAVQNVGG